MEIKPADKEIIDHKDLRYKRKVSDKGIKDMNKQAYEHIVGLVLSKEAGAQELWDAVKEHVSNNRLAYLGGATGAVLGAVSAIGGPWWRYLASGGAGAAVGAGIGFAGDRMRNRALNRAKGWEDLSDQNSNKAIRLHDELTRANAENIDLKKENDKLRRDLDLAAEKAKSLKNKQPYDNGGYPNNL